jgi:hypothetical protein
MLNKMRKGKSLLILILLIIILNENIINDRLVEYIKYVTIVVYKSNLFFY